MLWLWLLLLLLFHALCTWKLYRNTCMQKNWVSLIIRQSWRNITTSSTWVVIKLTFSNRNFHMGKIPERDMHIIECWFDHCFLKNYTFFFSFFLWISNPNKLLHVRHFVSSNNCNGPDLLGNTIVKLRSVYVWWLGDFDPRPLSVSLRLRSVSSSCYFD